MNSKFWIVGLLVFVFSSCQKWEDPPEIEDDRLTNPYCNDPEAVNYNWDFPGIPDSSTCFFPTEVFHGRFIFVDSIYTTEYEYDTFFTYNIELERKSKTHFVLKGFCGAGGTDFEFTANRYYRASADSLMLPDSSLIKGQIACRPLDTLNGSIVKDPTDNNRLLINFTVYSDTGTFLHVGSAIKQ